MSSPADRMPPELDAAADALSLAWNALVRGEPAAVRDVSPFAPTLRRLHALDDAPALSPERQARIWRDVMAARAAGPTLVVLGPIPPASHNGHAVDPIRPDDPPAPRQRWPMTFLAAAAVLALMLVSVLLTLGLSQPNRWLRPANPAGILADEVLVHQRLDAIPPGPTQAIVSRAELAPGVVWEHNTPATSGGPMLYRVETGAIEARAEGALRVTRRGASVASEIPAETAVDLAPGDVAFLPAGVAVVWSNLGNAPATLLDAGLTTSDPRRVQSQSLDVARIIDAPAQPPAAPVDLTLRRLTLAPGGTLSGEAPGGLRFVGVDAGTLEIAWARPAVANAIVGTRQIGIGAWENLDNGDLIAAELRNPGDAPLTLYLLTVAPIASPPAAIQAEPLLTGHFATIADDASWIGVKRYTAPPGAAWTQGAPTMSGVGPMLYRIVRGAVTVRTEGSIEVTRAGAHAATAFGKGATTRLASGDVASMPSGVVTQWRNDSTEPAVILDGGITTVGAADLSMLNPFTQPINDWGSVPPRAPVDFAVQRITLAPGAVMRSGPAPGMKLMAVESGAVDIVWSAPIAADLQGPRSTSAAAMPPPNQLTANHWIDINQRRQYASELRNAGSDPLILLVLTAAPAADGQAAPAGAAP